MTIRDTLTGSGLIRRLRGPRFVSVPSTPQQRRQRYERDGYVAGGPLLDRSQLERLRADFDEIFARRADPDSRIEHERHDDGAGGEFFKVYNLRRLSPAFHELVTHPRLAGLLGEITGCGQLRLLLDQMHYKPPGTGGWNGWHRDMPTFPFVRPYVAVTAWVPLDDTTEDNGCLRMVPGSHAWGDASDLAGDDWGLHRLPQEYHGHTVREVLRPVRAGHVQFHNDLTWHCSAPNPTAHPRRALSIHVFNADARYREGGRIMFPELSHGDPMDAVAPLVIETRADAPT
jgi:ectoine hydroxylase-related dioxygenase (phytanoyl-CoA dioxygenase family)